jgi:hypothetical protein
MGALLGLPSGAPVWASQQAGAKPLSIVRPKALPIQKRPPPEIGNIVGGAVVRLVGALMLEQNDEWAVSRRYMSLESLATLSDDPVLRLSAVAA